MTSPPPPASLPKPRQQKATLPPAPPGYHWRRSGAGHELRHTIIENGKRRHIYRGHLSQTGMERMKKTGSFEKELEQWIESKIR